MSPRRPISSASIPPAWRAARNCRSPSRSARIRSTSSPRPCAIPATSWRWSPRLRGEPAAVVKSLTNDILVPADAEMTLEGYLDERGYVEPEGPVRRIHGLLRRDPHGPGVSLHRHHHAPRRAAPHLAARLRLPARPDRQPEHQRHPRRGRGDAYPQDVGSRSGRGLSAADVGRLEHAARLDPAAQLRRSAAAIAALFGGIARLKHIFVFDEDIDIRNDKQVEWALGTRFQADQDLMVLQGIPGNVHGPFAAGPATGAKSGFDCTKPFGRDGEIPLTRSAAKVFKGPARFQNIEQALAAAPMFYADLVEAIGSDDGREIACGLDELRQNGRRPRPRRPLSSGAVEARRHRHRRRPLPRSQFRPVASTAETIRAAIRS